MAEGIKPIRRVVTGNDAQGRSRVLIDSAAPNVNANAFKRGTGMTACFRVAVLSLAVFWSGASGNAAAQDYPT